MGIDVNLYAEGIVTDAELAAAVKFFKDRALRGTPKRSGYEPNHIDIDMGGARYYAPGYERGPWPEIAVCIMATVAAFPNCVVHYGGDSDWESPIVDEDVLTNTWAHYLGPNWDDYHNAPGRGFGGDRRPTIPNSNNSAPPHKETTALAGSD